MASLLQYPLHVGQSQEVQVADTSINHQSYTSQVEVIWVDPSFELAFLSHSSVPDYNTSPGPVPP